MKSDKSTSNVNWGQTVWLTRPFEENTVVFKTKNFEFLLPCELCTWAYRAIMKLTAFLKIYFFFPVSQILRSRIKFAKSIQCFFRSLNWTWTSSHLFRNIFHCSRECSHNNIDFHRNWERTLHRFDTENLSMVSVEKTLSKSIWKAAKQIKIVKK